MAALKMLFISFCCLVVGAAGICAVISGPESILFAPLFAIFGWFYIFPIYLLVALMWGLYRFRFTAMPLRLLFVLFGGALGGGAMALQGALQFANAKDLPMHDGMLLGGILAGLTSNLMITLMKTHNAEPCAAPNGGSAALPNNSDVKEGPPSVS